MEKPTLSPDFTMEDLHKLREYNSLRHINMSTDDLVQDINKGASEMQERIKQMREHKKTAVNMTA